MAALQALNRLLQPDVILLARGGGSIEDLWAFNDEGVARAIVASAAPVITGVGHETDFTIADFAADLRAPTPTAAAELSTPDQADLRIGLDDLAQRLGRATLATVTSQRWALSSLHNRLAVQSPRLRVQTEHQALTSLSQRLQSAAGHSLALQRLGLEGTTRRLEALNPLAVLERGFAVVSAAGGQVIHHTSQVSEGQPLTVRVQDGTFGVRVEAEENEQPSPPANVHLRH